LTAAQRKNKKQRLLVDRGQEIIYNPLCDS